VAKGEEKLSPSKKIKVAIKAPVAFPPASRGFYQVEEEVLYVVVYPSGDFFSYLDSARLQIDVDRIGRLLFMHILVPRRRWRIDRSFYIPSGAAEADIRFLDFRSRLPEASLLSDPDRTMLRIRFQTVRNAASYRLADHLVVNLAPDNTLASIWVTAIDDDRAARGMAAWRAQAKEQFERQTFDSRLGDTDSER
jgi:hypothetical protein